MVPTEPVQAISKPDPHPKPSLIERFQAANRRRYRENYSFVGALAHFTMGEDWEAAKKTSRSVPFALSVAVVFVIAPFSLPYRGLAALCSRVWYGSEGCE